MARGEVRPTQSTVFVHHVGSRPCDLVSTSEFRPLLFSERFFDVLETHGFTGWSKIPVEVYGKGKVHLPGYSGLAVTGRCGPIDNSRSVPRVCPPPVPAGRTAKMYCGLYFDPASWDGSDIFMPKGWLMIVVTDPVRRALEQANLTNIAYEALPECRNAAIRAEFL